MFLLLVGLWLSLVSAADTGNGGEHQIRAGVCAGWFSDCALIAPQVEYANNRFVVGANSSLFVSNVYGRFYLNNHPRYKVSLGFHYGLALMPDEGGGNSADLNGVVASTDILFNRCTLRLSAGHLLFNDGVLVDLGSVSFSASAMYNFRLP
ncbi:MAG: hypothetical protein CL916_12850 [Deltaproteobacteria bacterium]|nr:hypothetical protein [Deltaproteobacteria bacterium]